MFCFFKKRRNRNRIQARVSGEDIDRYQPTIHPSIQLQRDREREIERNIRNRSEYRSLLPNRYLIDENGNMINITDIKSSTNFDVNDLNLSNYDVKAIIADNNRLFNYNTKLLELVKKLSLEKLKIEANNIKLQREISQKDIECNNAINDIITENERLNRNISSIIENENVDNLYICSICMDNIRDIIFTPCHHSIVCNECCSKLTECPMCRTEIKSIIKYYF